MQASELLQSYLVDANTWDEMYKDASVREQELKEYFHSILFPVLSLQPNGILLKKELNNGWKPSIFF